MARAISDATGAPSPTLLDLVDATDPLRCGGKAAGLARLLRARLAVPAGICLTTDVYRRALAVSGVGTFLADVAARADTANPALLVDLLATMRARVQGMTLVPHVVVALHDGIANLVEEGHVAVAIRSSAPYEDGADASYAGIHASVIVAADDAEGIVAAVKTCWASLWTERAWAYRQRHGIPHADAEMAVVVQRFVDAGRTGVAFSTDPVLADRSTVVIEAIWGTGDALVSGRLTPDHYRVTIREGGPPRIRHQSGSHEEITLWRHRRQVTRSLAASWRHKRILSDEDVSQLARLAKAIERALGKPVDVEWAHDGRTFWIVQARPITQLGAATTASPPTVWTRANLKEILPDLPSPLAVSYLSSSMNRMFRTYHVAEGYTLPSADRLVGVFFGRPYLNLTLMQRLTEEAGGDPAIIARLLGGAEAPASDTAARVPQSPRSRHHLRTAREMLATLFRTPRRARRLFDTLYRTNASLRAVRLERLEDRALTAHLEQFRTTMFDQTLMRRLHEVVSAQSRAYMAFEALLGAWLPADDGSLLTRLMTGLGTLPNVRMTYALMSLGALARKDRRVRAWFSRDLDEAALRGWEASLGGTGFRTALEAFLREFGHRGPYESDVMSPRFEDDPTPLLRLIQLYVRSGGLTEPGRHAADRRRIREAAMDDVRRALSARPGRIGFAVRWMTFSTVCRALQRLLALRDECRHVTTMMVAHLRHIALEIGRRATYAEVVTRPDDVFFVSWDELPYVLTTRDRDWRRVVQARREEYEHHRSMAAPDLLVDDGAGGVTGDRRGDESRDQLGGLGVSPGTVTGRVRVFRSLADLHVLSGDIVVFKAIEPTLTPIFPLVRGMIAEMGGLLSHAAILAREYGVPTVVSVRGATHALHDGDRIEMDGTTGRIRVLERAERAA